MLKRMANDTDIMGAVVWLTSDASAEFTGEIRARIGKAEPLVAIYVKDTNDFYMFHDVNKVMTHKVN